MKKLFSLMVSASLITGMLATNVYGEGLSAYKDVHPSRWSHSSIMTMSHMGLFNGTSDLDVNGVGTFSPLSTMSRAQFITVISRYICPDLADSFSNSLIDLDIWYGPHWSALVELGIISESDFGGLMGLNAPITREEVAYIISNTLSFLDYDYSNLVPLDYIPDISLCDELYRESVQKAYTAGIINGVDAKGCFNPQDTLTREQGAVILYRLIDPNLRNPINMGNILETEDFESLDLGLVDLNSSLDLSKDFGSYRNFVTVKSNDISFDYTVTSMREASCIDFNGITYTASKGNYFLILDILGKSTFDNLPNYSFSFGDGAASEFDLVYGNLLYTESKDIGITPITLDSLFSDIVIFELPLSIRPTDDGVFNLKVNLLSSDGVLTSQIDTLNSDLSF